MLESVTPATTGMAKMLVPVNSMGTPRNSLMIR